jgi:hypothetical protein
MIKLMDYKYVMRRRMVFVTLAIVGLIAAYYLVNHIWWTGSGYCWGDMIKCEGGL